MAEKVLRDRGCRSNTIAISRDMGPLSFRPQHDKGDVLMGLQRQNFTMGTEFVSMPNYQGRTNPAFSKLCLCLNDTRHFRHFHSFRGSEERIPLFSVGRMQICHFRRFRQNGPFLL